MSLTWNIPDDLEVALEKRASAEGKSVSAVTEEVLREALHVAPVQPVKRRDLSGIAGAMEYDPAVDEVLESFRKINPSTWE